MPEIEDKLRRNTATEGVPFIFIHIYKLGDGRPVFHVPQIIRIRRDPHEPRQNSVVRLQREP